MAKIKDILLNDKWCKSCAICIKICPRHVYDTDIRGKTVIKSISSCIGCGICEITCPDMAITLIKEE